MTSKSLSHSMNLGTILTFLKSLAKNNNRDWFEKNKLKYLEAKLAFEDFLEALHAELLKFDESLAGLNPRKLGFRIYRDVRFSKDNFLPKGKWSKSPDFMFTFSLTIKVLLLAAFTCPMQRSLQKSGKRLTITPSH